VATPLPTPRLAPVTSATGMMSGAPERGALRASDGGDFGRVARHPELTADAILDRLRDAGVVLQELLRVFAAVAEALAAVRAPRAALLDDALFDADVDERSEEHTSELQSLRHL